MPAVDSDSGVPPTLKEKVRRLPDRPGVYLMKDRIGQNHLRGQGEGAQEAGFVLLPAVPGLHAPPQDQGPGRDDRRL